MFTGIAVATRQPYSACARCALQGVCVTATAASLASRSPTRGVRSRRLARGDALFRAGAPGAAIYAVRRGCLKEAVPDPAGGDAVVTFHLPGEAAGLGVYASGRYPSRAEALTDTVCCEVALASIARLAREVPAAGEDLARLLAQFAVAAVERVARGGRRDARARVATFLTGMSQRLCRHGLDGNDFRLHMSRADIGAHLGIALETVSRSLAQLAREGLIRVHAKRLVVLEPDALARVASQHGHSSS
jgi:CRP/FNR family transcriptional regulator